MIDGQGGGIGKIIINKLRDEFGEQIEIFAFGTNAITVDVGLILSSGCSIPSNGKVENVKAMIAAVTGKA